MDCAVENITWEMEVSVRRTHSSRSSRSRRWQERTSACFDHDHDVNDGNDGDEHHDDDYDNADDHDIEK